MLTIFIIFGRHTLGSAVTHTALVELIYIIIESVLASARDNSTMSQRMAAKFCMRAHVIPL